MAATEVNLQSVDAHRLRAVWYGRRLSINEEDWEDVEIILEHGNLIELQDDEYVYGAGQVMMQWQDKEGAWHDYN